MLRQPVLGGPRLLDTGLLDTGLLDTGLRDAVLGGPRLGGQRLRYRRGRVVAGGDGLLLRRAGVYRRRRVRRYGWRQLSDVDRRAWRKR